MEECASDLAELPAPVSWQDCECVDSELVIWQNCLYVEDYASVWHFLAELPGCMWSGVPKKILSFLPATIHHNFLPPHASKPRRVWRAVFGALTVTMMMSPPRPIHDNSHIKTMNNNS